MNQAQPLSQGVLLHFCLFDPTHSAVAEQNKRPPADSKYWSLRLCVKAQQYWNIKNKGEIQALSSFVATKPQKNLWLVIADSNVNEAERPPKTIIMFVFNWTKHIKNGFIFNKSYPGCRFNSINSHRNICMKIY